MNFRFWTLSWGAQPPLGPARIVQCSTQTPVQPGQQYESRTRAGGNRDWIGGFVGEAGLSSTSLLECGVSTCARNRLRTLLSLTSHDQLGHEYLPPALRLRNFDAVQLRVSAARSLAS
jgi:hypothetical protein